MTDPVTGLEIPYTGMFEWGGYVVSQYLRTRVTPDIAVATQIPNPRVARMIICAGVTTGGPWNIALSRRRVTIHTYDTTEPRAMRMCEIIRGYLFDGMLTRESGFRGVTVLGEPCFLPDPDDPQQTPRAQMTVDLLVRARFTPYGGS